MPKTATELARQKTHAVLEAALGLRALPEADIRQRLEDLFLRGVNAGAGLIATIDTGSAATPADAYARAELAQAITTLGHLLPLGMKVVFYRPAEERGDQRVAIETTYPDGEVAQHWFTDLAEQIAH